MKGKIHSFQSLGTVDGPGVRCVVFMQGCPLRCICCHNPDTWDFAAGEEMQLDTLVNKILRFKHYFGNTGGLTVSGGEPLMQAEFVAELFKQIKANRLTTALDTSGCIYNEKVEDVLNYTDTVLLDLKYSAEEEYAEYVGTRLSNVMLFLEQLEGKSIPTWLRRVIIPGINDNDESVAALNETAKKYTCIKRIELLPYRNFCIEKYEAMGIEFKLKNTPVPAQSTMDRLNMLIDKKYR